LYFARAGHRQVLAKSINIGSTRMTELARDMPGYISHKAYVADDGERLTLFEWESADTLHISGRARQTMH
jgi:heme-degrading monooxygenase HmoA